MLYFFNHNVYCIFQKEAVASGYQKPDMEQESDKSSGISDISTKFSKMTTSEQYLKQVCENIRICFK